MVRFVIRVEMSGGAGAVVVRSRGSSAMLGAGDLMEDDMHLGEYRYGGRGTPGWTEAGYNASGDAWRHADVLQGPIGSMQVTQEPPIRVMEVLEPMYVGTREDGQMVFDAGREVSGQCDLVLRASSVSEGGSEWCKAGTVIRFVYGETLFDNGTVMPVPAVPDRVHGGHLEQMGRYECGGSAGLDAAVVPNRFMYTGFRYVGVSGWGGAVPSASNPVLRCRSFHTDLANASELVLGPSVSADGDESGVDAGYVLTRVVNATRASGLENFMSIPTDCPTREKRGWMGDSGAALLFMGAAFDMQTSYRKWLADIR